MLLISARIDWYSWFAAPSWVLLSVPFDDSVASVIARSRRLVTCASAPSATSSRPTPSVAFVFDCVSADELAARPFTKERPEASSAPELIRDPDDSCCSTVCKLLFVYVILFWAYIAHRLLNTPRAMGFNSFLDARHHDPHRSFA